MEVRTTLKIYDDEEMKDPKELAVESCWNRRDMAWLVMPNGNKWLVHVASLCRALANAENHL